jgi:purine-binding chemotaxis protein CheW
MPDTAETVTNTAEELISVSEKKHLVFSISGRQFAFPSQLISEIALFDTVYPLPLLPDCVLGVINRYSVPYALFDIGLFLFKTPSPRNKVLILKDSIDRIAFLIDDITGIADIQQEHLLNIERSKESGDITETVSATFNWNNSNVFILDIQRILARVT